MFFRICFLGGFRLLWGGQVLLGMHCFSRICFLEGLIFSDLFFLGTAHLFRDVFSGWVFQVFILFWSVVFRIGVF